MCRKGETHKGQPVAQFGHVCQHNPALSNLNLQLLLNMARNWLGWASWQKEKLNISGVCGPGLARGARQRIAGEPIRRAVWQRALRVREERRGEGSFIRATWHAEPGRSAWLGNRDQKSHPRRSFRGGDSKKLPWPPAASVCDSKNGFRIGDDGQERCSVMRRLHTGEHKIVNCVYRCERALHHPLYLL